MWETGAEGGVVISCCCFALCVCLPVCVSADTELWSGSEMSVLSSGSQSLTGC